MNLRNLLFSKLLTNLLLAIFIQAMFGGVCKTPTNFGGNYRNCVIDKLTCQILETKTSTFGLGLSLHFFRWLILSIFSFFAV